MALGRRSARRARLPELEAVTSPPAMHRSVVYTIGYGGRTAEGLVKVLTEFAVEVVCDVRSTPRSRFVPWANYYTVRRAGPLKKLLTDAGFEHQWIGDVLGNPKPRERTMSRFKALMRAEGEARIAGLVSLARRRRVCLLCASKAPERCHRVVIAAWLEDRGFECVHL